MFMRFPPFIVCTFFLLASTANAQRTTAEVVYGNHLFDQSFVRADNQSFGTVNTMDAFESGKPIQSLGVGLSGMFRVNQTWKFSGHFLGAKFLPQAFPVNDCVSGKISGCLYAGTIGYDLFPKKKMIDVIFSGGLNLGRTKLAQSNFLEKPGNVLHVKNMFISPKASFMVKLYLGKFCLSANAEYAYDISGSDWKEKLLARNKPASVPVPGFNQTSFNFSAGIGYAIPIGGRSNYSNVYDE
jgi:hypothetical protein